MSERNKLIHMIQGHASNSGKNDDLLILLTPDMATKVMLGAMGDEGVDFHVSNTFWGINVQILRGEGVMQLCRILC